MSRLSLLQVMLCCVLLVGLFGFSTAQFTKRTGDPCRLNAGGRGICTSFDDCSLNLLAQERPEPVLCAWEADEAIICCPSSGPAPAQTLPIAPRPATGASGSKAEEKCKEYTTIRQNVTPTIIGGTPVDSSEEFPHSVLIGYGSPPGWYCGGTLISDRFVLTAAHCLTGPQRTKVTVVHMGFVNRNNRNVNGTLQEFRIIKTHRPPDRKVRFDYADIALLEMDRPVVYSKSVLPACLHTSYDFNVISRSAQAFGWGDQIAGSNRGSDVLQKVRISLVDFDKCSNAYPPAARTPQGIVDATQFCAGDRDMDTCQGDSGGPLQIHDTSGRPRIIGVTSFGSSCGVQPGVYTRVSAFVPWIESVVWP